MGGGSAQEGSSFDRTIDVRITPMKHCVINRYFSLTWCRLFRKQVDKEVRTLSHPTSVTSLANSRRSSVGSVNDDSNGPEQHKSCSGVPSIDGLRADVDSIYDEWSGNVSGNESNTFDWDREAEN